jgi:hypothetical protein
MGPQVRPRAFAMNVVFVPLPAPGAPPSRMISFGNRSLLAPVFGLEALPDRTKDHLGVLDLEVGDAGWGGNRRGGVPGWLCGC